MKNGKNSTRGRTRRHTLGRACFEALEGRRLLSLAPAVNYATNGPQDLAVGDFNGDSFADLASANTAGVGVRLNDGDGTFGSETNNPLNGGEHVPVSVVAGDLNSDGKLDLAVVTRTQRIVGYYTGYYGGQYPIWQAAGHVKVLLGNGNGTFTPSTETKDLGDGYYWGIKLADLNEDGDLDAAVLTGQSSDVVVLAGDGDGTFAAPQNVAVGAPAGSLSIADVDGDANLDLVTGNSTNSMKVVLGNGNGTFDAPLSVAHGGDYARSHAVGDVNGDGKIDLVVSTETVTYHTDPWGYPVWEYEDEIAVLLGNGNGTFTPGTSIPTGSQGFSAIELADFDGDDNLDIAAADYAAVSLFSGNGNGTFDSPETVDSKGALFDLASADFDHDGTLDLAGTNYWSSAIAVMLGGYIPPPSLSISDASVTEGDSGTVNAVFTVTLSRASTESVTVQYAAADGVAVAGKDFDLVPGTLTFTPGQTSKNITVTVRGDVTDEYDEGFSVNLSSPSGAAISDGTAAGTIVDNDAAPTITITDVSKKEGRRRTTAFDFVVSLSAASEKDVYVDFATANGSATTAGQDYLSRSGTLVFTAGQTSKLLTINVNGDRTKEASETFFVNLSNANGGTITDAQGTGTILDDDTRGNSAK